MASTFCDRRVRQSHHKNRRASASIECPRPKRTEDLESGSNRVPTLLGLQEGVRVLGALGGDSQGVSDLGEAAKRRPDEIALGHLRMRAPGTQSFTCQAPPTQFSGPGPVPASSCRPPSLPPSVASGPLRDSCTARAGGASSQPSALAPRTTSNRWEISPAASSKTVAPWHLVSLDLSDGQRTSASRRSADWRLSSRPPSSSVSSSSTLWLHPGPLLPLFRAWTACRATQTARQQSQHTEWKP